MPYALRPPYNGAWRRNTAYRQSMLNRCSAGPPRRAPRSSSNSKAWNRCAGRCAARPHNAYGTHQDHFRGTDRGRSRRARCGFGGRLFLWRVLFGGPQRRGRANCAALSTDAIVGRRIPSAHPQERPRQRRHRDLVPRGAHRRDQAHSRHVHTGEEAVRGTRRYADRRIACSRRDPAVHRRARDPRA